MRIGLLLAGLIIVALGVAAVLGEFHYNKKEEVLRLGELHAEVQSQQTVPQWAGIVGIVLGGGLILAGVLKKN